jgi:hypothetical protein
MKLVIQLIRDSLADVWSDLWTVLVCNLLWTLSMVLVIPGPAATLALFYYTNRLAHGEVADLADYWGAFRRSWGVAWRWGVINLIVIAIFVADSILTGQLSQTSLAMFAQGFYLAGLAGWLLLQLFALPFLFEQETPSVRQALRNGAVMIGRNLGFTLALAGMLALLMIAGTILFMLTFAFGGVILAAAGNRAVLNRLALTRNAAPMGLPVEGEG